MRLAGQCLYHADAGDIFPHHTYDLVHSLLYFLVQRNPLHGDKHDQHDHNRRHNAQDGSQSCIHRKRHADPADQHDGCADPDGLHGLDKRLHIVAVGSHTGDQRRQPNFIHLGTGHVYSRVEKVPPDLPGGFLCCFNGEAVGVYIQEPYAQGKGDHGSSPEKNGMNLPGRHNMVNQVLHHIGDHQFQSGAGHFDSHHAADPWHILPQVFKQKTHDIPRQSDSSFSSFIIDDFGCRNKY